MVSTFMPDVVVEIAFDSGYVTPAASRTWTDVSAYVELADKIDIDVGRGDELSVADANTLSLTLDNSDGRFTAFRAASPYYPNVKIGRPIRVKVTPPGGTTVTRFVGFVDEWPVEWDGTDAYAKASIRATSRMARLGLTAQLKSMPEEEIQVGGPLAYWTMGDPQGATAPAESLGRIDAQQWSLTGVVTFGNATGPGTDEMTAAETAESQLQLKSVTWPSGPRTIRCWVRILTLPSIVDALLFGTGGALLEVTPGGAVKGSYTTGPNISDGSGHDLVAVHNGTTETLYVDGVQVASAAAGLPVAGSVVIGSERNSIVISHAAVYDRALTAAEVAGQAESMQTGYGERTDDRLIRILNWAGVASTEVGTEVGSETMTYQKTSGQSVMDALRECESTEGGVLFDGADGNVKFHSRSHRYLLASSATLDMTSQHVEADYAPKLDRSTLVNDITVDNPTTGEKARATDATSSDEYGIATSSATSVADSYTPLQEKASWLLASYSEPRIRVPSLTVDVLAHQGLTPSAQTLLGVTVGDLLTVEGMPIQAPFIGGDWVLGGGALGEVILGDAPAGHLFVEGYTESIGPESYFVTFNLSPSYPTLSTVILDDAIRGKLDAGNVLAY